MSITIIEAEPVKPGSPYILQGCSRIIGTGEASRILGVSRKTMQRILDSGRSPFRCNRETDNRIMCESDVIAYLDAMRSDRRAALNKLRDMAEDMGLYDMTEDHQQS